MSSDELTKSVAKRLLVLQRSINLIQFIRLQIQHFISVFCSLCKIYCNILPILVDSNFCVRSKESLGYDNNRVCLIRLFQVGGIPDFIFFPHSIRNIKLEKRNLMLTHTGILRFYPPLWFCKLPVVCAASR